MTAAPVARVADAGSRQARKKRATRARLLEAAHDIMSQVGVDDAKIRDITDAADVGFGTFYNYFETKDALASQVLDCMIHDCGIRTARATRELATADPAAVMPTSIRLLIREAAERPIWRWWAQRPDLLVDRVRDGVAEFANADMRQGIVQGFLRMVPEEIDQCWALACWTMVGGIHDLVLGERPPESERFVAESIGRAWGYDFKTARRVSALDLPPQSPPEIDWSFELHSR